MRLIEMKMVVAIVRPERLQCVKDALRDHGINGMTITHVTGRGEQMGLKFTNRVGDFVVDELEKVNISSIRLRNSGRTDWRKRSSV